MPLAMLIAIVMKIKAMSRESLIGLRKRMIYNAPTRTNARAMFDLMINPTFPK